MGAFAANLAVAAGILLTGFAALLMVVGLVSYWRIRHARLLWVSLAFAALTIEGAFLAFDAYQRRAELAASWDTLPTLALINLGIVGALYLAVLRP